MRAEVGLLTRNIKIYGDMKNENDTYGGHIKAFYGNNNVVPKLHSCLFTILIHLPMYFFQALKLTEHKE